MPKWTYAITIINNTDRDLELITSSVPWGKREKEFPKTIASGEHGEFRVFSPAGAAYGIEFYFSMRDKVNQSGEPHYGSFSFSVDVPYWKHENKSSFKCTGILTQTGFQKIPDGNHDFSTAVTISTTLCENYLKQNNLVKGDILKADILKPDILKPDILSSGYGILYNWDQVEQLGVINPDEKTIDDFIPGKNIFSKRKTVNRTEKISVPKKLWKEIIDKKFPDDYSKHHFVENYFTVSVYEIRKNVTVSIAANQSYEKTLEVSNRSTVRRETRQEFQIENTITGGYAGGNFSLSETLRMQYQISQLNEYCDENMKSVREVFTYNAIEQDRDIVLWDLVKVLVLYRVNKKGQTELVGVGDYFDSSTQKTYMRDNMQENKADVSMEPEEELFCANSEDCFSLDDISMQEMLEEGYGALSRTPGVVQGNIAINGVNYRFMEVRQGTNRGILFNPGRHQYVFTPNPHRDGWYNSNQQRWYTDMAQEFRRIGDAAHWTRDNWNNGNAINNLRVNGITYTAR